MEIQKFAEEVKVALEQRAGREVRVQKVNKNNDVILYGVSIIEPELNVTPTIYLEPYLKHYENGDSMEDVVESIFRDYIENKLNNPIDMNWFKDWELVCGKVAYKLINYERNEKSLKNIPHTKVLDLVKVYYVTVNNEEIGNGTILIYNSHLGMWGITAEQLEEAATENTPKLLPVQIGGMYDVLKLMMGEETLLDYEDCIEDCHMYVATNTSKTFGASVLCYEGVMREFAKKLETDFYILPSSIHETIIVFPKGEDDAPALREMVYMVNRTNLSPEEVLSDSVYYYSRENDAITIA